MPRPPARTRAASARQITASESASKQKPSGGFSSDNHGAGDLEIQERGQQASQNKSIPEALAAARRQPSMSSDAYGVSDRELKKRVSLRNTTATSAPQASTTTNNQKPTAGAETSRRKRDGAAERLATMVDVNGTDHAESPATRLDRETRATAQQRKAPDESDLGVLDDDDIFGDMDTSLDDEDLDSPPAAQSADTSSLFTRGRPRTSSIVGKDDAPIRPSSRGQNTSGLSSTFNLGAFKRRPREPSILGTGRKERAQRTDSEAEDSDGGLFGTRLESTFLSRTRRRASASAPEESVDVARATRSRKRKSEESQDGPSKRRVADSDDNGEIRDSIEVPSSPPVRAHEAIRTPSPIPSDSVLAPPASSGSEASPSIWPSLNALRAQRRRRVSDTRKTPILDDDGISNISSPPSLTHSPNHKSARKTRAGAAAQRDMSPVTTAALTSLLPRRRRRARDDEWDDDSDEELDTSRLGDEDDELAHGRLRRGRTRKPSVPLAAPNGATARGPKPRANKSHVRTYGSKSFSDKENQEDVDEAEVEADTPLTDSNALDVDKPVKPDATDELKNAAKFFKEVDKWELEFEEVTQSSSPKEAR